MKYKLICFDVDGTLVDNIEYSWQLFHDYFKTDPKKRQEAKDKFFTNKISYMEWAEHDINMWLKKNAKRIDFFKAMQESKIKLIADAAKIAIKRIARARKK